MNDRPLRLYSIDNDPIFRLGSVQILARYADFSVVADSDTVNIIETINPPPDIILIDPVAGEVIDLSPVPALLSLYPNAKIVFFSLPENFQGELREERRGVYGYIPKGTSIETIIGILKDIVRNNRVYRPNIGRNKEHWLIRLGRSGLAQIAVELESIGANLEGEGLTGFDRFYWNGRRRELLAAGKIIRSLIPLEPERRLLPPSPPLPELPSTAIVPVKSGIFEGTLNQIASPLPNRTGRIFEIDILKSPYRKELLYLVLEEIREVVEEWRFLGLEKQELSERHRKIILSIWEEVIRKFIRIHAIEAGKFGEDDLNRLVEAEREMVIREVLDDIPLTFELFSYLIYDDAGGELEGDDRYRILLHNLIQQVANTVVAVILNNFFESEEVKEKLFRGEYLSSREIARVRNDLSWQYRQDKYWQKPKAIFESKYELFCYREGEIRKVELYASRNGELNRLEGIQWLVSIVLELRDSLSPRLRSIFNVVGKAFVYVLISVIGRGIGLVIRGVLQGVGNTWQEVKGKK